MRKTSKKQTEFVIVWGGNLKLRRGNFPPKGPEKKTLLVPLSEHRETEKPPPSHS